LLKSTRIYSFMHATVKTVQTNMLSRFQEVFERHLDGYMADGDFAQRVSKNGQMEVWSSFIEIARSWLLSYSLVSLLPVVLSESSSMIKDTFTSTLDDALTPLWARFHFHLEMARTSRSLNQIVWTFSYAKSFVEMMVDLCRQMSSSGKLQKLKNLNYEEIAVQYAVDKCLVFMCAHVALSLVSFSEPSREFVVQLFEESVSLDSELLDEIAHAPRSIGSLSSVIFDARPMFHRWLLLEHSMINASILEWCNNFVYDDDVKFFALLSANMERSAAGSFQERAMLQHLKPEFRCYGGLHHCLQLLMKLCDRYRYFPATAQCIIAEVILEPLLCLCGAILFYRIQSNHLTYAISTATPLKSSASFGTTIGFLNPSANFQKPRNIISNVEAPPEALCDLLDSCTYLASCFAEIPPTMSSLPASVDRVKAKWSSIQNVISKTFSDRTNLSITGTEGNRLPVKSLVSMVMAVRSEFIADNMSNNFDYRSKAQEMISSGNIETLSGCVCKIMAIVNALSGFMKSQWTSSTI
jgi:hypothetical protein